MCLGPGLDARTANRRRRAMAVKWIGWYKAGVLPTYNLRSGCARIRYSYMFLAFSARNARQSRVPTRKLQKFSGRYILIVKMYNNIVVGRGKPYKFHLPTAHVQTCGHCRNGGLEAFEQASQIMPALAAKRRYGGFRPSAERRRFG